ncbi:uncharacterized protein LOC118229732 [Anguilla anguilla]|uniref:uncharacterized protein LOC118229732 n=1 Tax=Anguilla anguilla TaxID=7936 RepID=UPI0015B0819A|nr:uncharacterized protein LOC118229732 [Anguilla anguilla]
MKIFIFTQVTLLSCFLGVGWGGGAHLGGSLLLPTDVSASHTLVRSAWCDCCRGDRRARGCERGPFRHWLRRCEFLSCQPRRAPVTVLAAPPRPAREAGPSPTSPAAGWRRVDPASPSPLCRGPGLAVKRSWVGRASPYPKGYRAELVGGGGIEHRDNRFQRSKTGSGTRLRASESQAKTRYTQSLPDAHCCHGNRDRLENGALEKGGRTFAFGVKAQSRALRNSAQGESENYPSGSLESCLEKGTKSMSVVACLSQRKLLYRRLTVSRRLCSQNVRLDQSPAIQRLKWKQLSLPTAGRKCLYDVTAAKDDRDQHDWYVGKTQAVTLLLSSLFI